MVINFVYQAFVKSQQYTMPQQLDWAKSGKDHHCSFDEFSRFTDGVFDKLLRPNVLGNEHLTPAGFYTSEKCYANNITHTWLLRMATHHCFGMFMFCRGKRQKDIRR